MTFVRYQSQRFRLTNHGIQSNFDFHSHTIIMIHRNHVMAGNHNRTLTPEIRNRAHFIELIHFCLFLIRFLMLSRARRMDVRCAWCSGWRLLQREKCGRQSEGGHVPTHFFFLFQYRLLTHDV